MSLLTIGGVAVKDPSTFEWGEQDISDPNAGRTQGGKMYKGTICRKVTISLAWKSIDAASEAQILTAIDPENFDVTYHDPKTNSDVTKIFYVGDRKGAATKRFDEGDFRDDLSFEIIEV